MYVCGWGGGGGRGRGVLVCVRQGDVCMCVCVCVGGVGWVSKHINGQRAQARVAEGLCESGGGRPGLPSP